jgi:hypothetical protein
VWIAGDFNAEGTEIAERRAGEGRKEVRGQTLLKLGPFEIRER